MVSADTHEIIRAVPALAGHKETIDGRAMLCRRTTVFRIECVVRGFLSGSAWNEYRTHRTLAGASVLAARFLAGDEGRDRDDVNISISRMREIVGVGVAEELEHISRAVYERGRTWPLSGAYSSSTK
jgi:phosphoribosylaminoimidazole-succinocarboxamide synthase